MRRTHRPHRTGAVSAAWPSALGSSTMRGRWPDAMVLPASRFATSLTVSISASPRCMPTSSRSSTCMTRCSSTANDSYSHRCLAREPLADPREELVAVVEDLVRFSSEDVVRHQLLFQRTIAGFEPSDSAMEPARQFVALMTERLHAAGVDGPADVDVFSAIVAGLAHQQVANDPGGDRWVHLARRVVEALLADVDRRSVRPTKKPATTRRVKK